MGLNWLITGGCGFIGRNLVKNLLNEGGHYIRVIDNLCVGTKKDLAHVCEYRQVDSSGSFDETVSGSVPELVVGDILDPELTLRAAKDINVIVHLAANTGVGPSVENPRKDCETNIIGTVNYLEAARKNKVGRFVFASSGAPAGECEPSIHEELPPHPVSPYGASKLAGEGYCSAYWHSFGVETVCLRFGNVYGPLSARKNSVVAKFIKRAMRGRPLEIYGDGSQTRDFIYIDDLIDAVRKAADSDKSPGEIFQIATSRETSVHEMVDVLLSLLAKKGLDKIKVTYGEKRTGDVMRNFSDTSKAGKYLGWKACHTLEQGLEKTIEFFMSDFM